MSAGSRFHIDRFGGASSLHTAGQAAPTTVTVETTTLDAFCADRGVDAGGRQDRRRGGRARGVAGAREICCPRRAYRRSSSFIPPSGRREDFTRPTSSASWRISAWRPSPSIQRSTSGRWKGYAPGSCDADAHTPRERLAGGRRRRGDVSLVPGWPARGARSRRRAVARRGGRFRRSQAHPRRPGMVDRVRRSGELARTGAGVATGRLLFPQHACPRR